MNVTAPRTIPPAPVAKRTPKSMRAETQNLVEEIKQSVRLLRRHL
jgi:hypothetical protein